MPFQPGVSGNPKGRPKLGESFAEQVRAEGNVAEPNGLTPRIKMIRRMWALAAEPHDRPNLAIRAAEWVANHGWPEESHPKNLILVPEWRPLFALPGTRLIDVGDGPKALEGEVVEDE